MKLQFFRFLLASSSIFSLLHKSYASLSDIFNVPKDSKEVDPHNYGVDVSFPIHYYLDRSKAPVGYDRYAQMMKGCYDRYSKRECDSTERARLAMNRDQPRSQHNYTEMGFKKLRVPLSAWEPLLQFYENNKAKKRPETWPRGNTYVNHWETPSYLVSFEDTTLRGGWAVKDLIWNGVKPIIENWVGHRVKPVSLYGIRIYQEGAMLSTHVDRLPLVSSCIINVDQDLDEPWPIEVYSHEGKAYNVTMQPGDMVLYESHTVLHGRPFPLRGRHFANVFVHFEPLDHEAMNREDKESPKLQRQSQTKDSSLLSKLFSTRREERHAAAGHEQLQHDEESLEHHDHDHDHDHDHHLDAIEGGETIDSIVEKRRHRDLELSASAGERKNPVSAPAAKEEDVFAPSVEDKFAALRHAASHGDVSTLQVLLDKQSLRREDENKWQLLHEAIRAGDLASVKFLVESGADLHAKVKDGGGALWLGRKFWDDKHPVIKYLVQVGAPES